MESPDNAGIPPGAAVAAASLSAEEFVLADPLALHFEGFRSEAFEVLDVLRLNPHVEAYRTEKARIREHVQEPFKRYRDDLVVNWILPNRLDLETERNVFSRLLKNDFGAGGSHHHMWMSFYRPRMRRLSDVQLAHSLSPAGFSVAVYVGRPAPNLFKRVRNQIVQHPGEFTALLNPLLQNAITTFHITYGTPRTTIRFSEPLSSIPPELGTASDLAVRVLHPRDDVLALGPYLVEKSLRAVQMLWPLYRYCLAASAPSDEGDSYSTAK